MGKILKILVIGSDPLTQGVIARVLRIEGYEVAEAETGQEALRLIERTKFDVAIAGEIMPGIDTWSLPGSLSQKGTKISWILVSVGNTEQRLPEIQKAGFVGAIDTPIDRQALIEAVKAALPQEA